MSVQRVNFTSSLLDKKISSPLKSQAEQTQNSSNVTEQNVSENAQNVVTNPIEESATNSIPTSDENVNVTDNQVAEDSKSDHTVRNWSIGIGAAATLIALGVAGRKGHLGEGIQKLLGGSAKKSGEIAGDVSQAAGRAGEEIAGDVSQAAGRVGEEIAGDVSQSASRAGEESVSKIGEDVVGGVGTSKVEITTVEIPKPTTPNVEPARVETPSVETPVVETPVTPTVNAESVQVKQPKVETQPTATTNVEVPKGETPVVETTSVETPRVETPVTETPSAEVVKPEATKVEFSVTKTPSAEVTNPEVTKVEGSATEISKTEAEIAQAPNEEVVAISEAQKEAINAKIDKTFPKLTEADLVVEPKEIDYFLQDLRIEEDFSKYKYTPTAYTFHQPLTEGGEFVVFRDANKEVSIIKRLDSEGHELFIIKPGHRFRTFKEIAELGDAKKISLNDAFEYNLKNPVPTYEVRFNGMSYYYEDNALKKITRYVDKNWYDYTPDGKLDAITIFKGSSSTKRIKMEKGTLNPQEIHYHAPNASGELKIETYENGVLKDEYYNVE